MLNELLILRHAKSDWQQDHSDFDRPLNARGIDNAPRVGLWLKHHDLVPERVLSSPARRARQTTEAVCQSANIATDQVCWIEGLYLADTHTLLQHLRATPPAIHRLLLVGHNPGLEELVLELASGPVPRKSNGKLLTTAALVHFQVRKDWRNIGAGDAEFKAIQYPENLDLRK